MMRKFLLMPLSFLILFAIGHPAVAQPGVNDPVFNPADLGNGFGTMANSQVYGTVLQPDGKIIIVGIFTMYNGVARNGIARLNIDGSLDLSFNPISGSFPSTVLGIGIQSDGKIIIGGGFSSYDGVPRNKIARLNPDGTLDPTFDPGLGANFSIFTIAIQIDGKIIISGAFTSYNGSSRNNIARLNTDGNLDATFNPGTGFNNLTRSISIQTDNKIIIGGNFTTYNGTSRNRIARINNDGSLDPTFNPGTGIIGVTINKTDLQADGKIIIAGSFSSYNGTSRNGLARINSNGTLDASLNPGTGIGNFTIFSVASQPDGKLIIAGNFQTYNGTPRVSLARVNADGTLDASLNPGRGATSTIRNVLLQTDGKIIISGDFTIFNRKAFFRLARINSDGTPDNNFFNVAGTGPNGIVRVMAVQSDNKILIGGDFSSYNGSIRNFISRLNEDGTLDESFNPGTGTDITVNAISIQNDGKIILGGTFFEYNGTSRIALARINPDGSLDAGFNPGTGTDNFINSTALQPDGKIIIAGNFTTYNGTSISRIARINTDGSLDISFNPGTGANNFISKASIQADGKIIIGGLFTTFNGTSKNHLARLNSDGSLDASFNIGTGTNGNFVRITNIQSDGKIIIGGDFTSYNGTSINRIARLNSDGTLDPSYNVGTGVSLNTVFSSVQQPGGKLIIGGTFTTYNGIARNNLARINSDGTLDATFNIGTGANDQVYDMVIQNGGKLVIGGAFTNYSGIGRNFLARVYLLFTTLDASTNVNCKGANNGTISVTVSGGTAPYTFAWSKDGIPGYSSNEDLTNLAPGIYNLLATDASGLTTTLEVTITEPELLTATTIGTNVNCNGNSTGSASVSVTGGTEPYSYLWSNSATTASISNLAAGIYTVTFTDAHGCTATSSYEVTQPVVLVATASGTNADCNGNSTGSASVSVTGGTEPYSYLWSNGETSASVSNLEAGTYTITVTDANGCIATSSYEVTEPDALVVTSSSSNLICYSNNTGSASVSVTGGTSPYSYLWSNGATTAAANNLATGYYSVIVTDANGCTIGDGFEITEPDLLVATATGINVDCNGNSTGSIVVNVTGGTSPYSYLWSNPATTSSISNLLIGNYSVTVTDINGCTTSAAYTVTQPAILTVTMTGTAASCNGSSTATPAGGTAPYSYSWSNGATTQSILGAPNGTYSVTVSDAHNCTVTGTYTITGNSPINPTANVVNLSCFGGTNGSITVTGAGGVAPRTYSINGSTYQASNVFSNLPAGVYVVAAKDATGCVDFVTKTINQPSLLIIVLDNVLATCAGTNNGVANITASGGNGGKTYSWTGPGGFTSIAQDLNSLAAGNYTVTVTDNKGCTASLNVTVPEWPAITISEVKTNVACRGGFTGAINTTIGGGTGSGFTISWTGPPGFSATTEDISGIKSGNYTLTVTDIGSGCIVTKLIVVTQPASNLGLSTARTNVNGCSSLGTITATASGGTAPYEYSVDGVNYQPSGLFTGLQGATYTVYTRDLNGCSNTKSVTITDNGSDAFEANNGKNAAKFITTNTSINARIAPAATDIDWFKFTTGPILLNYSLLFSHSLLANFAFDLYTNSSLLIAPASSSSGVKTYNTLAVNTTYFIKVSSSIPSFICYQLTISNGIAARMTESFITEKGRPASPAILKAMVYPNPHQGNFTLQIESPEDGIASIQLLSANGRLITTKNEMLFKGRTNSVDFSNIREAILFYRVRLGKHAANGKIIGPK